MSKHHQIGDRPMTSAERQLDEARVCDLVAENTALRKRIERAERTIERLRVHAAWLEADLNIARRGILAL